jgi:hypothetical protein
LQSFEVVDASSNGEEGDSTVRYIGPSGAGSYVIKQHWRLVDGGWRVASQERPADQVVPPTTLFRAKSVVSNFFGSTARRTRGS